MNVKHHKNKFSRLILIAVFFNYAVEVHNSKKGKIIDSNTIKNQAGMMMIDAKSETILIANRVLFQFWRITGGFSYFIIGFDLLFSWEKLPASTGISRRTLQ